jgi:CRP/FNR family transcriptional regulator, anaerobic regulatory protein
MFSSITLDRPTHLLRETARPAGPVRFVQEKCSTCRVSALCLPGGLTQDDLRPLRELALTTRNIEAGQTVFSDGDPFRFLYAVRRGTCKTTMTQSDGREQVAGFHIAGEVMGLEALAHGAHALTAKALEDSEICLIPYRRLAALTAAMPQAKDLLTHLMSQEIVRVQSLMVLLGLFEAAERLAAFLVNLSERYAARGYSPRQINLRMTRGEIASFLGVQPETISRTLALFQRKGLVEVKARQLRIADLDGLKREYEMRLR